MPKFIGTDHSSQKKKAQLIYHQFEMTIQKLIRKCFYKPVFNFIYKYYLKNDAYYTADKVASMDLNFLNAWNELTNTQPKTSTDKDVEDSCIFVGDCTEDDTPFVDVCLLNKANNEVYGIDFLDWNVLVAKEIKTDLKISDSEMLAHILWELTFWGFSSKTIQRISEDMISEMEELDIE